MNLFLRNVLIPIFTFAFHPASGLTLEVTGKNGEQLFRENIPAQLPNNVGHLTTSAFANHQIPFVGTEEGVQEILGLGTDVLVLSATEMKVYGWCFSVDGVTPSTLTHETWIANSESAIHWYYAYTIYQNGVWGEMCLVDR